MSNGPLAIGGLVSGIDTQSIVGQLVAIEKRNQQPVLRSKDEANAEKSAILELKTKLTSLRSAMTRIDGLNSDRSAVADEDELLFARTSGGDDEKVSVTAADGALRGTYALTVEDLASTARRDHAGVADKAAALSVADASFSFSYQGGDVQTVAITAGTTSLEGLRDAINALDSGVRASVVDTGVDDGSRYRLVLDGQDTGSSSQITVDASSTLAGFGEADFATKLAGNAQYTLNGIQIESSTNTSTPVEGVTFDLKAEFSEEVTVTVEDDVPLLRQRVRDIADQANEVITFLQDQFRFNEASETAGVLSGDSLAQGALNAVRQALTSPAPGSNTSSFGSLSDLGLEFQRDGTVEVNLETLDAALEDPDNVTKLLASTDPDSPDGLIETMSRVLDPFLDDDGSLTGRSDSLDTKIERLDERLETLDLRAESYRARLERQFNRMEATLAGLSSTQQFFATNQIGIYA